MEHLNSAATETNSATLETLPTELQLQIFDMLDYRSSIMLSQTSHHFHATVSPRKCHSQDKTSFVRAMETSDYHDWNLGFPRLWLLPLLSREAYD